MKVDLEHLHHWMCAIRQSQDPMRTLDAFWQGQMQSKEWLIAKVRPWVFREFGTSSVDIDIHGGWVGVLASMIFQSEIPVNEIRSIDLDPACEPVAREMNRIEEIQGKFKAITADMCNTRSDADLIINTSCEHINQFDYDLWLNDLPDSSLIVLQSNDYEIPEHVRTAKSLEEFKEQCHLGTVLYSGEFKTQLYTRWMIIGKR